MELRYPTVEDLVVAATSSQLVTIIVPAYNEAENLPELNRRLSAVLSTLERFSFEIVFVDNCSTDNTFAIACEIANADSRWRCFRFSRNFTAEASLAAGLEFARGGAVIFLFSDLQEPPESIPEMLEKWEQGFDVVYGRVRNRADKNKIISVLAKAAYLLIHRFSNVRIPPDATDYRLLSRRCVEALKLCRERNRYIRGLVHWVGFRQTSFDYDRAHRTRGKSSTNFSFLLWYASNAFVSFSSGPLLFASLVGMAMTFLSITFGAVYAGLYVLSWAGLVPFQPPPAGWTTQMLVMLFFSGVQCMFLGVIGKYLSNVYEETKQRPLWLVDTSYSQADGFDFETPVPGRIKK